MLNNQAVHTLTQYVIFVSLLLSFDYHLTVILSGRTGRKGNTGTSYTLFTPNNAPKARDLVSVLTEAKQVVNPKLQELVGFRGRGGGGGRGGGRGGGGGRYGGGGGGGRW